MNVGKIGERLKEPVGEKYPCSLVLSSSNSSEDECKFKVEKREKRKIQNCEKCKNLGFLEQSCRRCARRLGFLTEMEMAQFLSRYINLLLEAFLQTFVEI